MPRKAEAHSASPAVGAEHHPQESRLTALAASRADAYKQEVEELRVALARAKLHQQQMADEHAETIAAMTTELEARGRGEMLARSRCEVAEVELRSARKELTKLREVLRRDSSQRSDALGEEVLDSCKRAMRQLAQRGLREAVLGWRRRALRGGVAQWAASARLMFAAEIELEALTIVRQASSYAKAEARAADPTSPEGMVRQRHDTATSRRLRHWFLSEERRCMLGALGAWRMAACAFAAKDSVHDVSGRLRHAQGAIREVLDSRSAYEDETRRTAALARALVGAASLHGVRRDRREKVWSMQLGFRAWVLLALGDYLARADSVKHRLEVSRESDAMSAKRAEALTRELQLTRNNVAAAQKRARDAEERARGASDAAAKADEQRDRAEALAKLSRTKAESLEREKYAIGASARKEKALAVDARRDAAGVALRAIVVRDVRLRLARGFHKWAADAAHKRHRAAAANSRSRSNNQLEFDGDGSFDDDDDVAYAWRADDEPHYAEDERPISSVGARPPPLAAFHSNGQVDELEWAPVDSLPVNPNRPTIRTSAFGARPGQRGAGRPTTPPRGPHSRGR